MAQSTSVAFFFNFIAYCNVTHFPPRMCVWVGVGGGVVGGGGVGSFIIKGILHLQLFAVLIPFPLLIAPLVLLFCLIYSAKCTVLFFTLEVRHNR